MRLSKVQRRITIIAASGLLVVILGATNRLGPMGAVIDVVVTPMAAGLHSVGVRISSSLGLVGSARDLANQNAQLRKENADLRAALARAAASQAELAAIKREQGIRELAGKKLIPAEVVSTQPDSYRAFVTINRGRSDGLTPGMVVVSGGTLVGTISQVSELTAKVLLASDPSFRVSGQVLTADGGATGTVRGAIGGGLTMEKIPQDQKISVGDTVITSGLGGSIVKGYSLGVIQTIKRADNGVFQSARLTTPIRIGDLQTVFVVGS